MADISLVMTDRLRGLAVAGPPTETSREAAIEKGMRTLKQDAIRKILKGVPTFDEMLRVVFVNETV